MERLYTPEGCQHTTERAVRFTRPPRDSSLAVLNRHKLPHRATKRGMMYIITCGIQLRCDELLAFSKPCIRSTAVMPHFKASACLPMS
eukprot:4413973-Pleurochrysis_carterae.AAC.1